ncbi:HAMP domain-containing protein [Sneathiella sp. P13V-1]|uniref:methyl-accepting chemotaxis protein n=1 Tax=Sneathiella sp. P13V-1 TaxID=2697366 RepID=UPI00187B15B9|nr:HAMP domain-containing methyl-accepting chemotaxis protein [Sneathiella sp. P13V-1]MBE7636002.1 HAMP domain-containing protein [Sneathiella sp. P13V-1]
MNFRNLSISLKLLISPAIFVIALVILGVSSYSGNKQNGEVTSILNEQSKTKTGAAYRFQRDLQAFNGSVFRLISQLNAGVEEEKIQVMREQLRAVLAGSQAALTKFIEEGEFDATELEALQAINTKLGEYSVSANDVIDMTEIDGTTAVVMMVAADEQFNVMYKQISEIAVLWQEEGDALYAKAVADGEANTLQTMIVSIVCLVIALGVTVMVTRLIRMPILSLTSVMAALSQGDNSVEIPSQSEKNEIGEMARAVQVFKDNAIEQERLRSEAERHAQEEADRQARERAEKEERERSEREREQREAADKQERAEKVANLISDFETRVSEVLSTVAMATKELQSTADRMTETAGSSRELAEGVASASADASQNVQTVASAAEELTSSISEISRQVQQANHVSEKAVVEASNSTTSVSALAETAKKISEVVNMINDIAGQTNLLALNATIEAARAGDAGKGFAVVASEVKSLANQTARATEEIAQQINDMQAATDSAVLAIGNIDTVISSIRESTVGISSAIEEQSAATNEISRNVLEASNGTTQVSEKIGDVSQKAGETGVAAGDVQSAASRLEELSSKLKNDIEGFLSEVRAA